MSRTGTWRSTLHKDFCTRYVRRHERSAGTSLVPALHVRHT